MLGIRETDDYWIARHEKLGARVRTYFWILALASIGALASWYLNVLFFIVVVSIFSLVLIIALIDGISFIEAGVQLKKEALTCS